YVMRDRAFAGDLIDRAKAAGCSALALTLDLQILGQRHSDIRNGVSTPPRFTPSHVAQILAPPRWALGVLGTRRQNFGNSVGPAEGASGMRSAAAWAASQPYPELNWNDVAWIKQRWGGKLVLKGILDAEDARLAVQSDADAIVVSNHGVRQMDCAS